VRIADALSIARIVLTLPLAFAILAGRSTLAGAIAVVALSTDFFDGYFARRSHSSSSLGRVLDPLADKVLAAGALGALLAAGRVPAELVVVVIVRDVVLLAFGWVRIRGGAPAPAANTLGKVAFTTLGVFLAGAVAGVRWPAWAPGLVGGLYVVAGLSYATRLPAPFRRAVEGKR
jgi:CDP-diacylglycerol--glycerol-3-phosphate 3-phosphatidyltransferase